ncbi:phage tail assembly chaperone G [Sediminibacillus halophilus]|uniref:Uncharacterized protein n=1 Tax=Sediminibacillus halophilus TaxID=482461 RepID=A0A1G9QUG3_9BACI|nr:hypothetical protein [Sediminibacillus halophilus]SDM14652.1 hypothetical protein SAMN05216244_1671 [Sediminibacillus halophilus]
MANLKRHMIELVTNVTEEGEVETKKFLTPPFIKSSVVYEAIDINAKIESDEKRDAKGEKELYDEIMDFVANRVYGGQFTKEELFNGIHAPDLNQVLIDQIIFVARGVQNDATKKYLAKKR